MLAGVYINLYFILILPITTGSNVHGIITGDHFIFDFYFSPNIVNLFIRFFLR